MGPVVADGDSDFAQAVEWSVMATVQAWEFGIDSSNVEGFAELMIQNIVRTSLAVRPDAVNEGLGLPVRLRSTGRQLRSGTTKRFIFEHIPPIGHPTRKEPRTTCGPMVVSSTFPHYR